MFIVVILSTNSAKEGYRFQSLHSLILKLLKIIFGTIFTVFESVSAKLFINSNFGYLNHSFYTENIFTILISIFQEAQFRFKTDIEKLN